MTVIAGLPFVVSAVTETAHAAAPESCPNSVTVGVPRIAVAAALAPRLIANFKFHALVSPVVFCLATISQSKIYAEVFLNALYVFIVVEPDHFRGQIA